MTVPDSPAGSERRGGEWPRVSAVNVGGTVRFHFPGGRLSATDWTGLAHIASETSAVLRLTTHGHVEIQGVTGESILRTQSDDLGLFEDIVHDRAHKVLASPMAGRLPGHHDLADLPEELSATLLSRPGTAEISQSWRFGFDDGSGDVLAHLTDLTAVAWQSEASGDGAGFPHARIYVRDRDTGMVAAMADVVTVLVDVAVTIGTSTNGRHGKLETGELLSLVVVALSDHPLASPTATTPGSSSTAVEGLAATVPPVGWVDTADGSVSLLAVVPDGHVHARLAEFLGAIERPSTISADKVIGLHGLTEAMAEQVVRVLAPMGMIFDAESPWVSGSV